VANVYGEISIKGMRKAHLRQLSNYIHERDREEWHYGNKEQFESRHKDLIKWVDDLCEFFDASDVKIAK